MYTFELPKIGRLFRDINFIAKAVDTLDPITAVKKPRGYGGCAIIWNAAVNDYITELPECTDRFVVIEYNQPWKKMPLIITSVYLPARSNAESETEFNEVLAQLEEIVMKYSSSHQIVMAGDWNASLSRAKPTLRDGRFKTFIENNCFKLPNQQAYEPTFHGNDCSSCIDYFLFRVISGDQDMMPTLLNFGLKATNVSDHTAISITIKLDVTTDKAGTSQIKNCIEYQYCRPSWRNCDIMTYRKTLKPIITYEAENSQADTGSMVQFLADSLRLAAKPFTKKKKSKQQIYKVPHNDEIADAIKCSKLAFWRWKNEGRPQSPNEKYHQMKSAKKLLRQLQRQEATRKNCEQIEEILQSSKEDKQLFYKLINKQRSTNSRTQIILKHNGSMVSNPHEVCGILQNHFGLLVETTDVSDEKHIMAAEVKIIENYLSSTDVKDEYLPSVREVKTAIHSLNMKKSPDCMGLMSEHLVYGGESVAMMLHHIVTRVYKEQKIPACLKEGILTPIHKSGRPKDDASGYRGITILPIIYKIIEIIIRERISTITDPIQNQMQRGFTKKTSPSNAALLLTEAIAEAKHAKLPLFVTLLDVKTAFDVVWHDSLLKKLYNDGINPAEWLLIKDSFHNSHTRVKWDGLVSNSFPIQQGVKQGSILGPTEYKRFIDPLLHQLQSSPFGFRFGTITCPASVCADDIALLSTNIEDHTSLITLVEEYSIQEKYNIQATKSCTLIFNRHIPVLPWSIRGELIPIADSAKHLGLVRSDKIADTIDAKLTNGRKALYGLMGAGLHGVNGLNPVVSIHIMNIYIIPIMTYGLEAMILPQKCIDTLEVSFRRTLRQLQSLPGRVANCAVYILLNVLPLEATLHRNMLGLLGNILRNRSTIEYQLVLRQSSLQSYSGKSWFSQAKRLLAKYNLPSLEDLIDSTPSAYTWKHLVKKALSTYWKIQLINAAAQYSSLQYMSLYAFQNNRCHPVWTTVCTNLHDVKRATVKVKLLTNTYTLMSDKARFTRNYDSTCMLCREEPETLEHFILNCKILEDIRFKHIAKIHQLIGNLIWTDPKTRPTWLLQIILDCQNSPLCNQILQEEMEMMTRRLCWDLHMRRKTLMS